MIRNFENTEINSAFPPECIKVAKLYGIGTIFFIKRTFSFVSISEFHDLSTWIQAIKDGNIIPLFHCKDFVDESDPDPLEPNGQNYLYLPHQGKYKFVHQFNYNYDFAANVKGLSQGDFDYIFADRNGNIVGYTPDGTEVRGFETDSITVAKLNIGTGQTANFVKITVELSESSQLDLNAEIYKTEWSINQNLRLVPVSFFDMELTSMKFTIKDSVYGKPINHLMKSNFIIDDGGGVITFDTFKKLGDGSYYLNDFSSPPGSGQVVIDSKIYYGSGAYGAAAVTTVNIFAYGLSGLAGYFWFKLTDPSSNPITGKVQANFSWDSGNINYFLEKGDGVYVIGLSKGSPPTTGTLYFDDGNYSGNAPYDFTLIRLYDTFEILREDALSRFWPFSIDGASVDPSGTYQFQTSKWRIVTTGGGDAFYVYWIRVQNGVTNRITIDIASITGELKFVNGANSQAYTTSGIKTFDWTGDGTILLLYMNSVDCLISDIQVETL